MKTKTPLFMIVNLRLPNKFLFYVLMLTGAAFAGASAATIYPVNNGFEEPDLGSGAAYQPPAPGWTFGGGAGIAANGSGFNVVGATNGNNDNGATSTFGQAAFVQSGDGTLVFAFFSQTLTLAAGSYTLNFSMEGRSTTGADGVNVFLNGVQTGGTLLPASLTSFNDVSVNFGNLAGGSYTIAFAGDSPTGADVTTFIDNVKIVSTVPDSGGTLLLMLCSGSGLLMMRRFASVQLQK
jgi:hypothetical protein